MKSGIFSKASHNCRRSLNIIVISLFLTSVVNGITPEDSLKFEIKKATHDSVRVDLMVELSGMYMASDLTIAREYALKAIQLGEQIHYYSGLADAYRLLGNIQYTQSQFKETLDSWLKSLAIYDSVGDKPKMARVYANLGALYESQSQDSKALEYNLKSRKLAEEIGDTSRLAYALTNIGVVYGKDENTYNKALVYDSLALTYASQLNNKDLAGTLAVNMGEIYFNQHKDSLALEKYLIAEKNWEGTESLPYVLLKIGLVYTRWGDYEIAEKYQNKALRIAESMDLKRDMASSLLSLAETKLKLGQNQVALKLYERALAISLEIGVMEERRDAYKGLAGTYSLLGDFKSAYKYQNLLTATRDSLYNIDYKRKLNGQVFDYEIEKKQSQISLLNKDKEIAEQLEKRQRFAKNASLVGLSLVVIILFIIFRNYRAKVRINKILDQQKDEIEGLLLNILPQEVAAELQRDGHATPMYYESVSVLFTDFKGFSTIAEGMSPRDLVTELNEYFSEFDDIIEKYQLEKIKTIGDAYMCAGGIPTANSVHPVSIVKAALDIQQYMIQRNERRMQMGLVSWELRIGIHTGPVVAGVVGRKKYAYDIWGNAVNIASRMESNGQPGRVNISAATYNLVKEHFKCTYRGKIEAKNIGIIDMYFVEGEQSSDSNASRNGQAGMQVVEA